MARGARALPENGGLAETDPALNSQLSTLTQFDLCHLIQIFPLPLRVNTP
jgi:hypothetical protein